jgi:hypothetical protein
MSFLQQPLLYLGICSTAACASLDGSVLIAACAAFGPVLWQPVLHLDVYVLQQKLLLGRVSNSAVCVASGHFCHIAACTFTDVIVLQQLCCLDMSVLQKSMLPLELYDLQKTVLPEHIFPTAAFAVPGRICSTAACASLGSVLIAACAVFRRVCPTAASGRPVLGQPVLPLDIYVLQQTVLSGCVGNTSACAASIIV